jgi:hypothetical protein
MVDMVDLLAFADSPRRRRQATGDQTGQQSRSTGPEPHLA